MSATDMAMDAAAEARAAAEPQGPKPRRVSPGRIGVYAFLVVAALFFLIPLYIMIVTSLKGMPEIRLGNLFNLPAEPTIQPWLDALWHACTGRDCYGLSPGFLNSVKITVPSVIVSIVCASINGYALTYWPYKGANILFGLLVFGAFVPYQVVIYPLIIGLSSVGLFASLPGIIIIHTIFGMPLLTLLFRNFYASLPVELFKAGAGRRRRLLAHLLLHHDPDVGADHHRRRHPPGDRHLERLPVRRGLRRPLQLADDGAAQQHRQHHDGGQGVQRQHGGDDPHGGGAADRLFRLGPVVRPRHRRRRGERVGTVAEVSVKNLGVSFGHLKVLRDLNLEVDAGEFIVLLGPSGCGKSTLLNAIAGLLDINAGQIWIDGKNVTWEEPKDRGIGMVFQSYALYPRMTAEGNLTFGLRVARVPKDEIARRVEKTAELLQIKPLLNRRPSELSGGQRQRVAIGRALVRDVDVFLFDEPLSNLDAKLRTELRVELKKLHNRLGSTMIYVTHDQIEALTLADRIAVMHSGVIQQLATPKEIYRRPVNRFVAGFVGSPAMNFIEGRIARRRQRPDRPARRRRRGSGSTGTSSRPAPRTAAPCCSACVRNRSTSAGRCRAIRPSRSRSA